MTQRVAAVAELIEASAGLRRGKRSILVAALLLWPGLAQAEVEDAKACADAITSVERLTAAPPRLLRALALVESGRLIATRSVPWPWTINVAGAGHYYESKADAIAAVQSLRSSGLQSIDVGCMQINLAMHPHAFASLDEAFDPVINAAYGARFVLSLFQASGSWGTAITSYHSKTPEVAANYARRVLAVWPEAAVYGLSGRASPAVQSGFPSHFYAAEFADRPAQDRFDLVSRTVANGMRKQRSWGSALPQPRYGTGWPGQ